MHRQVLHIPLLLLDKFNGWLLRGETRREEWVGA